MIPNMSRFNPMGHSSTNSHSQSLNKEKEKDKDGKESNHDKEKTSSIASIASMATMGKSMTKKLGAGFTGSNVVPASNPLNQAAEFDKKAKQAAIEKKQQITQALSMLEDVHLQCPQSHTGIILAYTGSNCAPIMHPGIKFTWYRMSGEDQIDQLEESGKAWYAPSVDDIGSVICLQCEDNYYQGCSRYIECGPIKADSLLCSLADSAVENSSFETSGLSVSLGLGLEKPSIDIPRDSYALPIEPGLIHTSKDPTLTSVLSKTIAFLQFDGRSTVEVDSTGIFISIPTFDNTVTSLAPPAASDKKPAGIPSKRKEIYPSNSPKGGGSNTTAEQNHRNSKFKTPRRGLRIPASSNLKVTCAQPLSLVLSVPIKRALDDDIDVSNDSILHNNTSLASLNESTTTDEEERMRRFLTSSTVSIPWSYEGHNHSPEAYFQNDPTLTYEEKQELLKEAEKDSVIFANTVCALAEFISALPENINEICFCFSCPDRLVRDTMVLSMRSLAFLPSNCSRYERKSMFPWLKHSNNTTNNNLIAESSENEKIETKRILNKKEEENIILKKERNELTLQLLESREELVNLKNKLNTIQNSSSTNSSNNDNKRNSLNNSNNNINKKGIIDEPFNGFPPSNTETNSNNNTNTNTTGSNNNTSSSNMSDGKAEAFKQLSSKIIELENKLAVASKREMEISKARNEIEERNTILHTDLTKSQRLAEDLNRKVGSLQSLNDIKTQSIGLLESDQEKNKNIILEQSMKLREFEILKGKYEKTDLELTETKEFLLTVQAECEAQKDEIHRLQEEISTLQQTLLDQKRESMENIAQLQLQLNAAQERIMQYEADAEAHLLVVADCARLTAELEAAHTEKDRLTGEINHLQQKSESLSRDLKKHMKDSASSLTEFEKALVRKSEECNELYTRLQQWEKAEEDRLAQESNGLAQRVFKRIGSIHIPEGLGIGATGRVSGRSSPTSEDEHSRGKANRTLAVFGSGGSSTGGVAQQQQRNSATGSSVFGTANKGILRTGSSTTTTTPPPKAPKKPTGSVTN